ncbi:claudin-4-like [Fundulus diaphanus]
MASMGMQVLASALCIAGWIGVFASCVLPMWRVTAFVGSSIVTSQTDMEGIWMSCVFQSTGHIQCKPFESQLALSADTQAARALMVLALATGSVGLLLAFVGGKCTRFLDKDGASKGRVAVAAGLMLMVTGLLCLIPTAWAAMLVVRRFHSAAIDAQRRELGACLYIGWGAAILLILGGGLFIHSACPLKAHDTDKNPSVRYVVVRSSNGSTQVGSHLSRAPTAMAQPIRTMFPEPQSMEPATAKPQLYTRYEAESEQDTREDSEKSWAPSTKSQMKRPESRRSEHSEAPSTKSQLKRAELDETLSVTSENEDDTSNPTKTYL